MMLATCKKNTEVAWGSFVLVGIGMWTDAQKRCSCARTQRMHHRRTTHARTHAAHIILNCAIMAVCSMFMGVPQSVIIMPSSSCVHTVQVRMSAIIFLLQHACTPNARKHCTTMSARPLFTRTTKRPLHASMYIVIMLMQAKCKKTLRIHVGVLHACKRCRVSTSCCQTAACRQLYTGGMYREGLA